MANLVQIVQTFIARHCAGKRQFLVGFSGGADSTALLLSMHLAKLPVKAVHFNHGIRGEEADQDEAWCRAFCGQRDIPFLGLRLNVPGERRPGESLEEAARRMRLREWQRLSQGGLPVFLAHHGDDAAEELFLRLARGSNVSALTPLRAVREVEGVTLMRPLLPIRRMAIESWLREQGIDDWRIDRTNADNGIRRNAVRNLLLPLFRQIFREDAGLRHALQVLETDAECLEGVAASTLPLLHSRQDWAKLHPAIFARCTRLWLAQHGVSQPLTGAFLTRLQKAMTSQDGRRLTVPLNRQVTLLVTPEGPSMHVPSREEEWADFFWDWRATPELSFGRYRLIAAPVKPGQRQFSEAFSGEALPSVLHVRHWQPGDTMIPFGSAHTRKLQDIFTDAKTPKSQRHDLPVLTDGQAILWVPTLRRAEYARVTPGASVVILAFDVHGD
ncbi:MAG: tRNA lysidine(34) synthetase TilS [Victivallales bacterium]|nr:tRNA lysidine(34) synthetase TilS [Victivallales bacterium]